MKKTTFDIRSYWRPDGEQPEAIARNFLATIDRVNQLDPSIANWDVVDLPNLTGYPLVEARARMPALVAHNVHRDLDGQPDPNGGYWSCAMSNDAPGRDGDDKSKTFRVTAGSKWRNCAEFEVGSLGAPPDPALVTYPLYRQVLEIVASIWPAPWAWARAIMSRGDEGRSWTPPAAGATKDEWLASMLAAQPPPSVEVPWMLYLSAPFAEGLAPPPELSVERTPGGGLILSAMLERPAPENPDHLRRGRMLGAIMDERLGAGDKVTGWGPRTGPY
ncbi:MAG: hypothetical protein P4L73_14090 [Caulobacteraceae bacterium]|nr:hypothetical protein [Caulobacteraceae bacterium]